MYSQKKQNNIEGEVVDSQNRHKLSKISKLE